MKKLLLLLILFCLQLQAIETVVSTRATKLQGGLTRVEYNLTNNLKFHYLDDPLDEENWRFSENQGENTFYVGEELEIRAWFTKKPKQFKFLLLGKEEARLVNYKQKDFSHMPTFVSEKYENINPNSWFFPKYAYVTTLSDGSKWTSEKSWRRGKGTGDKIFISKQRDGSYRLISLGRYVSYNTPQEWLDKGYIYQKKIYGLLQGRKIKPYNACN